MMHFLSRFCRERTHLQSICSHKHEILQCTRDQSRFDFCDQCEHVSLGPFLRRQSSFPRSQVREVEPIRSLQC